MVQAKHQKSKPKPKKLGNVKKPKKQDNISEFRSLLDALGLKIIQVTADGNCFFRSLADQLEGSEEEHGKYRLMVIQYILKHREKFEPFIEDDVPFDEYCQSMEKDGTWAGHMELQAASLATHSNICIHRVMSPRWYIRNFDDKFARMVHLSYHNEEHYNSLRLKEDPCNGPAKPIVIKVDADVSAASHQAKDSVSNSKRGSSRNVTDTGSIKLVMAGSGCESADKVEQVLQQLDGDVDAAIEFLIAEQGIDEKLVENDSSHSLNDIPSSNSGSTEKDYEQPKEAPEDNTCKHNNSSKDFVPIHDDAISQQEDKKIPRNKLCPCGSKKKYKACCGSVTRKSSTEFVINQKVSSSKGKNARKPARKGGSNKISASHGSERDLLDVGALCI